VILQEQLLKNDFLFFQTLYGLVSTNSAKSTIISTTISDFEIVLWDSTSKIFFSNNANTALGDTVYFAVNDIGGTDKQSHFDFDIIPSVFTVSVDNSEQITCLITVDVTFLNTDSTKKRMLVVHKRFIQQGNTATEKYQIHSISILMLKISALIIIQMVQ
jgi:hypothetical protein